VFRNLLFARALLVFIELYSFRFQIHLVHLTLHVYESTTSSDSLSDNFKIVFMPNDTPSSGPVPGTVCGSFDACVATDLGCECDKSVEEDEQLDGISDIKELSWTSINPYRTTFPTQQKSPSRQAGYSSSSCSFPPFIKNHVLYILSKEYRASCKVKYRKAGTRGQRGDFQGICIPLHRQHNILALPRDPRYRRDNKGCADPKYPQD